MKGSFKITLDTWSFLVMIQNIFKLFAALGIIVMLSACETPNNAVATAATISAAEAAQDAKLGAAESAANDAKKAAERAQAMAEQNQSALRALNDKIDRMFKTMSRK